jgi:hypothetical protein
MRHRIWIALLSVYMLTVARRDVFQNAMELDDEQKDTFWNIYADYDQRRASLTDQAAQLLRSYETNFGTLTNKQASKMLDETAWIAQKQVRLRRRYADQISKKLGGRVGARFYQIDDYLNTAARLQILDDVPFVGDPQ